MPRTAACLGILLLSFAEAASADSALTISRPPSRNAERAYDPGAAAPGYRGRSARWEIIHRRAAVAARQRAARIAARRRAGYSALRPNLSYDRPLVEWRYAPWYVAPRSYSARVGSLR